MNGDGDHEGITEEQQRSARRRGRIGGRRTETERRREERNEARHISLACADSSSFVTVVAINNSAILSLWIIRVGLRARAAVAPAGVVFRSIQFGLRGRYNGLEKHAFQGMCHSSLGDMACDLGVHLGGRCLWRVTWPSVRVENRTFVNVSFTLMPTKRLQIRGVPPFMFIIIIIIIR